MHIINKAARLIDFSFDKKNYRLMPAGESVEVPDKAMNSAFLKALIEDGSIQTAEGTTKSNGSESSHSDEEKERIEAEAEKERIIEQAKADAIAADLQAAADAEQAEKDRVNAELKAEKDAADAKANAANKNKTGKKK